MTPLILEVDDDAAIRDVVAALLDAEGYRVATAADGIQALRLLDRVEPALIILDMQMPGLSGCDVAREVRARRCGARILMLSACRDLRRRADESGADACLPKPFELDDLLTAVARLAGPPAPPSPLTSAGNVTATSNSARQFAGCNILATLPPGFLACLQRDLPYHKDVGDMAVHLPPRRR
jgi:DNA-binding response OmpR family regulator